jgi:hypothetical protein
MSEDAGTTGGDLAWQSSTERSGCVEVLRSPGFVWFLAFLGINYVALGLAMVAHGAGFDNCDGKVLAGEVVLPSTAELALYGAVAVGTCAGLAVWRLRGRQRLAALVGVALSTPVWLTVILSTGSC